MCYLSLKNHVFLFSFFRHVTFLLETMHDHLSDDEKKELSVLLESSAKQSTGSPKETDNNRMDGLDIPSIPLARMPLVRQCQRLVLCLRYFSLVWSVFFLLDQPVTLSYEYMQGGMVASLSTSVLTSRSSVLGSSPRHGTCIFTVPLSTQEYKWIPANVHVMLGVSL